MSQLNKPETENIEIKFEYQCPLRWQNLEKTDDEKIRFCLTCEKKVTFIESREELYQAAYGGSCGFFMGKGDAFLGVKEADKLELIPGMPPPPPLPLGGRFVMPPVPPENIPPKENLITRIKNKIFGLFFRR